MTFRRRWLSKRLLIFRRTWNLMIFFQQKIQIRNENTYLFITFQSQPNEKLCWLFQSIWNDFLSKFPNRVVPVPILRILFYFFEPRIVLKRSSMEKIVLESFFFNKTIYNDSPDLLIIRWNDFRCIFRLFFVNWYKSYQYRDMNSTVFPKWLEFKKKIIKNLIVILKKYVNHLFQKSQSLPLKKYTFPHNIFVSECLKIC